MPGPNIDGAFGMWPTEGTGGSSTPKIRRYTVKAGYTTRIGKGSPLILTGDGTVQRLITTNTTVFVGVAANHWQSLSGRYDVFVFDDPNQTFEMQADEDHVGIEDIGLSYAVLEGGVNATTLISKVELDSSGGAAQGVPKPLKLVGISSDVRRNSQNTSWTGCIVRINEGCHIWAKNSGLGV